MKNKKMIQFDALFYGNQNPNPQKLQVFMENLISSQSQIIKKSNQGQQVVVKFQGDDQVARSNNYPEKKSLSSSIQWTSKQTDTLFYLFQNWGSKWTKISQQMKGRSENCIKNRFYGNLRKVLRRMNKAAKNLIKKFKKQLKFESITRIIDASQGLFRLKSPLKQESESLTKKIIELAKKQDQEMTPEQAEILIKQINKFNMLTRSYKSQKKISNRKNNKKVQKSNSLNGSKLTNTSSLLQDKIQISDIDFEVQLHPSSTHQQNFMDQQAQKQKKIEEEELYIIDQGERQELQQNKGRKYSQKYLEQILMSQIYSPLEFEAWI